MKSLNYITIINTINELSKVEKIEISNKLLDILNNNELPKAENHNRKNDLTTSFFKIELDDEVIEEIFDLLINLEVASLTESGESSEMTNFYVDLLDKWSN
ncbi:hypothetical protein [Flavobacterium nackdongense]|uniref:Uncharacterized protein n=1 Tax=Flavobacterium nackdongense TaxID=2547394 RepID=A0A4P6YBC7_9FLAO|nr:hypothetical protein [Flavobacterium nackdongense]QBN18074.1 hypothetical protein E1750_04405 [Flavobacterium nackdongense]